MNSGKKKLRFLAVIALILLLAAAGLVAYILLLPAENEEPPPSPQPEASPEPEICAHSAHHPDDLYCLECGEKLPHDFSSGTCPLCGKTVEQTNYCLDYSLWLDLNDSGTVETVEYETKDYGNGNYRPETKKMQVYLPYGYSENRKYNVLVLLHGSGGDENYWFSRDQYYTYPDDDMCYSVRINILLDNMIYYKYCEPLIVVSPTYYLNDYERDQGDLSYRDSEQFRYELRNDILPYIVSHYSTYAEASTPEAIISARDHFGLIGASYGAYVTYSSVIASNTDMVSWIGAVSGCKSDVQAYIAPALDSSAFDNMNINFFYTSAGENDSLRSDALTGYLSMLQYCSKINTRNCSYLEIKGAEHEDRVWDDAIYNCLLIFFR